MQTEHTPVLLTEALELLNIIPNKWYVDATFGRGGHTKAILNKGGKVIAFDWDAEAISYGNETFAAAIAEQKLILIRESFSHLEASIEQLEKTISGILFDFGTSVPQLTSAERGFSFEGSGELDMRMDTRLGVTAKDILMLVPEKQLAELFREFGGEVEAKAIAHAIKTAPSPITTTSELATLVVSVKKNVHPGIHPATKVFQALRIAVNSELDEIAKALPEAFRVLTTGNVLVAISFHDGEDRIIKHQFKNWERNALAEVLTKKPIMASEQEINTNKRARSAKLRALRKLT